MEIVKLAKNAGFCFGVRRAVEKLEQRMVKGKTYTLGAIIHNKAVCRYFEQRGVEIIDDLNDVKRGDAVVVRSHGVGVEVIRQLEEKGAEIIDATCPFVRKIQDIVAEQHQLGKQIVIFGDRNHPEVVGINGYCENSAVMLDKVRDIDTENTVIVAQTTADKEKWYQCTSRVRHAKVYDTICDATSKRQEEASELAEESDCMLVIGDKMSSNTSKLEQVCMKHCDDVYKIEDKAELERILCDKNFLKYTKVGITAGASTPGWIIEEVHRTMDEMLNVKDADMNFEEELEKSLVTLKTGDIVKGRVIRTSPTEIYVDLGFKADGVIPIGEMTDDPTADTAEIVSCGDEIEVFVVRVNDVEGQVLLSRKKLDSIRGWRRIENSKETNEILQGKIVEAVKGGVVVFVEGVRVFVPASQTSERYVSDLSKLVGQQVPLRITDINMRRRKVVGNIKQVLVEQREKLAAAFWADAEVGKQYEGVVKTLTNFGAFVDLGGIDGLVHVSELSWGRVNHPSEVVSEGDKINVFILELDSEKKKISLGYKKKEDNPWEIVRNQINVDDVIKVKIVRFASFGAFAEIVPGVDALIHISQISNCRLEKPEDALKEGQEVEAMVVETDWEHRKIGLSIRALLIDEMPEDIDAPDEIVASTDTVEEE